MVEANVKIIEELQFFLKEVSSDSTLRKLITENEHDFTRCRKLPLEKIVGMLINLPKLTLSVEIQAFFKSLGADVPGCTKGAFSLQRAKLKPVFFAMWNKWLVDCFYHYYGSHVKLWRNFRVQAVDGSCLYLFNKEGVREHFGSHSNQHGSIPMARVMQIHDVLNDITVWGDIYPIKIAELPIMAKQVPRLGVDTLTLFDRGFPSFELMYLMMNEEVPRHFVMRCKINFNNAVKAFLNSPKRSKIVELKPTDRSIEMLRNSGYIITSSTTIKVRLVKVDLKRGQTEILITNLFNERLYSVEDLKYLYGLRWKIETTYYRQKNQLQLEQFSGHRVICIEQDYHATLFVGNIQSLIEKQCETNLDRLNQRRKLDYKINRNLSVAFLKNKIVSLFLRETPQTILMELQNEFQRHVEPVRSGRQNVRNKRKQRVNGKYQTFTNYKRAM